MYKGDAHRKKQRSVKLSRNDSNSGDTVFFSGREYFRITVSSHDLSPVNSTSKEAESI